MTALSSRCEAAGSPSSGRIWGGKSEAGLICYEVYCALSPVPCAIKAGSRKSEVGSRFDQLCELLCPELCDLCLFTTGIGICTKKSPSVS